MNCTDDICTYLHGCKQNKILIFFTLKKLKIICGNAEKIAFEIHHQVAMEMRKQEVVRFQRWFLYRNKYF